MSEWHGYAIVTVTKSLGAGERDNARGNLLDMGRQTDPQPANITVLRESVDGQKWIVEAVLASEPNEASFEAVLGADPPAILPNEISAAISPGADWEARRQWVVAQIMADKTTWGEDG